MAASKWMKSTLWLCLVFSLSLWISCALRPSVVVVAELEFVLSHYASGPAVEGARVRVWNEGQVLIGESWTDEHGRSVVAITQKPELVRVTFTKYGYGISVIEGLKTSVAQEQVTESIMRKAELFLDPSTQEIFPNHEFRWYYPPEFWGDDPILIDPTEPFIDNFAVEVQIHNTQNHIQTILYPQLGRIPSEPKLSKDFDEPIRNNDFGEFSVEILGHHGGTDWNLVMYDYNGNRYHRIVYLEIQPQGAQGEESALPEQTYQPIPAIAAGFPNIISFTRRMGRELLSDSVLDGHKDPQNRGAYEPGNLIVGVFCVDHKTALQHEWIGPDVVKPDGYRIYRSFDGENWHRVGFLSSEKADGRLSWNDPSFFFEQPGAFFAVSALYIDPSNQLEAGREVFYAVTSVYGPHETPKTLLGSVIPLETFSMRLINPGNQQVETGRQPEFQFGPQQPLESEMGPVHYGYRLFLYDQVQDLDHWIIPVSVDQQDKPHFGTLFDTDHGQPLSVLFTGEDPHEDVVWYSFFDGQSDTLWQPYPWNRLEAHKTYSWGVNLAFAWAVSPKENAIAFSIASDYHPYRGSMGFDPLPYGISPDWMFEFTTGTD